LDGTTPVSLQLPQGLSYDQWRDTGLAYARLGKAVQWWLGDWLVYGDQAFGELYAQAASETGYSEESLRGFQWVSGMIEPRHRNKNLSWSHHQVAAGQDEPEKWLNLAETAGWSVRELREAIKPPKKKAICGYEACPMRKDDE
jgi:hypothetical protein